MSFKQIFFSFKGRLNRAKFFWYSILVSIISVTLTFILGSILLNYAIIIGVVISLLFVYPYLVLAIKRFHDINTNGIRFIYLYILFALMISATNLYPELQILTYIAYFCIFVVGVIGLILIFKPGTVGKNQYGEDLIKRDESNVIENVGSNKRKRKWGRILALSIPGLGILWLVVSFIFWIIGTATIDPTQATQTELLLVVIKSFLNRLLGMLGLLSIPGTIVGIVLLTQNKKIK